MIRMLVNPLPETPEDARTLARATLADLATGWTAWPGGLSSRTPIPGPTWLDSRERITQALNAQMIQTPTGTR